MSRLEIKGLEEAKARELAARIGGLVQLATTNGLALDDLDGIVVARDYPGELKSLERDRGGAGGRTDDGLGLGVAKAVPVERDGARRTVLVFDAAFALGLLNEDEEICNRALGIVLHELWHLHERRIRNRIWANAPPASLDGAERFFLQWAEVLWEEYSANRQVASLDPNYGAAMAESIRTGLKRAQPEVERAIKRYRVDGDFNSAFRAAQQEYDFLIRAVAYMLGNLDGNGRTIDEVAPGLKEAIAASTMSDFWPVAERELQTLHERFPDGWPDLSIFRPLIAAVAQLFVRIGVEVAPSEDHGIKARFPIRAETMPTAAEAAAFRSETTSDGG